MGRAKVRGWGQQAGSDGVEHLGFVWRQWASTPDQDAIIMCLMNPNISINT